MEAQAATLCGSVSGTTTASYVAAATLDTRGMGVQGKLLLIINNTTAATTSMYYKIDGYAHPNSAYFVPIKAQTSIAAATQVVQTDVDKGYANVVISVIDNSGHATYQIDWCTY
jgi:hypothetical protein